MSIKGLIMKLKVFTLASILMLLGSVLYAQIRDYVFIVRPIYDEKALSFMDQVANTLNERRYRDLAAAVSAQKSGRFGSGFLFVQGNRRFVITNQHVVGDAATVNLELEAADGTKQLFEGTGSLQLITNLILP